MIRARSPLFGATYFFALLLGVGTAWLLFTTIDPILAMESWVETPRVGNFRTVAWILSSFGVVGLLSICVVEIRVLRGWEPAWLRRFIPGCLVVDIYKHGSDPKEHRRIEVQSLQGWANWYILDSEEVGLCEVGDTIHLWAIGKHVAHLVVVDPSIIRYPAKARIAGWSRAIEVRQSGCAWILMFLSPIFSGGLIGKGLEHLIFGRVQYSGSRRGMPSAGPRVATGFEAQFVGGILLVFGVLLAGWVLHRWLTGWDDEELAGIGEHVASSHRGWRGWWI